MSSLAPLFAQNWGEWIGFIIAALFAVIYVVGQLLKLGQQPQQRPGGRPPGGGGAAGRPPGGGLEDEIGEFLRRAAQHRQGQPAARPRPGGQPAVAQPAVAQPAAQQFVEAEVVGQPAIGEGIKQHVGKYLDAGEFRRRAAELGEEVAQTDEQLEQRLHTKFDHKVSRLTDRPGESASMPGAEKPEDRLAELPSTAAAGLAAMFSRPESIRQAIVINEILTRPEDRWT
jgi:hypothetical protein